MNATIRKKLKRRIEKEESFTFREPNQPGISNFLKKPKTHTKAEKKEVAKEFALMASKCQVSIKFLER